MTGKEVNLEFDPTAPQTAGWRRKLMTVREARAFIERVQGEGKKVVFANGCFDLLHAGHISYLEGCRALGDALVLGLNSDSSIQSLKGAGRPIYPQEDRVEILAGLECVDVIVVFEERSCDGLLEALRPDIHAKGTDYTAETVPERITAQRLGIRTVIAGAPKENSTRDIIELVQEKFRSAGA